MDCLFAQFGVKEEIMGINVPLKHGSELLLFLRAQESLLSIPHLP